MASSLDVNLPPGFVDLATAYSMPDFSFVNMIGVVVDVMPPTLTRKGEHTICFRLLDRKLRNSVNGSEGLLVRFFKQDISHIPQVRGIGDVVLLREIKLNTFQGQRTALSNFQTGWLVFPAALIPNPSFSIAYQDKTRIECLGVPMQKASLNLAEQSYVMAIKQDMSNVLQQTSRQYDEQKRRQEERALEEEPPAKKLKPNEGGSRVGLKYRKICDLQEKTFVDLRARVVKIIPTGFGITDLYVTDYTPNELMRYYPPPEEESSEERDGDTFGYSGPPRKAWPGPFEWLVLKVNLKPPHAAYANQSIKEGDFVLLQNVKMRITDILKLEGDIWPDDKYPGKVQVVKILHHDVPEIQDILRRKDEYDKKREAKLKRIQAEKEEEDQGGKKKKKKEKKREKKEEKKRKKAEAEGEAEIIEISSAAEDSTGPAKPGAKSDNNQYVRCGHEEVHLSRIRDILDPEDHRHTNTMPDGRSYILPFVNARFRAKVRVVDFEPKDLQDFAVQPLLDEEEDSVDSMAWNWDGTPKYEWHFSLLLEDATKGSMNTTENKRIWVNVHHQEAQFLFGNNLDDPRDLRMDSKLLAKLKEAMFVLWGNLEEKDEAATLKNKPFECCVMEYGIELDDDDPAKKTATLGWQRMYSMFGATIL